jgi:hypothetical protein
VKKIVKGLYCPKDARELGPDDVRNGMCKRCETKAIQIEYCLKFVQGNPDPKAKKGTPPPMVEDRARISYECEKCGAKSELESEFKHKDDCKAALGGIKKVCSKSGHFPHASAEAK